MENSQALLEAKPQEINCLELAPENYMHTGGKLYREFRKLAEFYPLVFHGLSMSVGSLKPLDRDYLKSIKAFIKEFNPFWYSDHLCYSSVMGAQFHNLLPLPLTEEAIRHVVPRIRQVQDFLEVPFAVENISAYAYVGKPEMSEWDFVREVVEQADCGLLLDVNNIYVNSVNFGFEPKDYINAMPMDRVMHVHVAGHQNMGDYLLDNHGTEIIDPVWEILSQVAERTELPAVIIERDHHLPPLEQQLREVRLARQIVEEGRGVSSRAVGGTL